MSAQALSIAAILFSWGFWGTGLLGFVSFVMLQVSWCCKMSKCGLITAGVFASIAAAGCIALGLTIVIVSSSNSGYYDDDAVAIASSTAGIVVLIGGALWIACAVCVFIFACGRMQRLETRNTATKAEASESRTATEVVMIPSTPTKKKDDAVTVQATPKSVATAPDSPDLEQAEA